MASRLCTQRDPADDRVAGAVRAAMRQAPISAASVAGVGRRRARGEDQTGDAAHQAFSTAPRNARQRATTGASANSASNRRRPAAGRATRARAGSSSTRAERVGQRAPGLRAAPECRRPGVISSLGPSDAAATTGRPADHASITTLPSGSWREGQTSSVGGGEQRARCPVASRSDAAGRPPPRAVRDPAGPPAPARPPRSPRATPGSAGQRADQHVESLVAVQPAERQHAVAVRRDAQRLAGGRRRAREIVDEVRQRNGPARRPSPGPKSSATMPRVLPIRWSHRR